jgi:hypothetical protein
MSKGKWHKWKAARSKILAKKQEFTVLQCKGASGTGFARHLWRKTGSGGIITPRNLLGLC